MTLAPSGIYKITNLKTGLIYIGQSENIFMRKKQHFTALHNGTHPNTQMQKDYSKQNGRFFRWDVVEYCELKKLNERENYWIQQYNSFSPHGYNHGWQPYKRKENPSKRKSYKFKGYHKSR